MTVSSSTYPVAVIGTGPAGLTAAIYAARAGLTPVLFAGLLYGGQLTTTTDIENFPGFAEPISGPKLMAQMTEQAQRVGATLLMQYVTEVDLTPGPGRPFRIRTDEGEWFAWTVIIATGAQAKTLKLAGEEKLMGRGVSTCATCDGFFYRKKTVAVVGGGDSAMEEALYLANLCREVILIHRQHQFRASQVMVERAKKSSKIRFLIPYQVTELLGEETGSLSGIKIQNVESQSQETLSLDGLFYAVGHSPNSELFKGVLDMDEHGYLVVHNHTHTRIPGVFAAGDISDSTFRQAVTAAGFGCQAALQAARFLKERG